jgi:hypothetical protein
MPYALDEEALNSPDMSVLDIGKPPTKQIPTIEFPKMVYLHPKDKLREHRTKIVQDRDEQEASAKLGWRTDPHIPQVAPDAELEEFEYEGEVVKRGRPAK